ncbi:MAG: LacI family DNA-binding transcriptional regulator [Bacteroidia bacterium]|nr:LacI family DNA-binding transcriptional regulator [Bacteroidia bacterium]
MIKKKISINDIARSLGVSKTLVSLVINNKSDIHGISKITQQKVWDKIKEMNYKPNLMARNLRLGRSNTIGLIVSDISNPFYSRMARHIEDLAEKKGYNLIICSTDEKIDKEIALIKMLKNRQVDGLIISSSQKNISEFNTLLAENYPLVLVDRCIPKLKTNYVTVDNTKGAYEAVEHLIKQGYERIAAFAISPVHVSTINDRIQGYLKALKDHKLNYGNAYLREIPFDNVKAAVKKEFKKLIEGKNKIQALFAINNNIATACMEAINENRIKVPHDLALVCFDDVDLFKLTSPTITAVAQPIDEICENALKFLFAEISSKGAAEKKKITLATKLIIRRSSVL